VDSREQDDWVFARMLRVLRDACLDWGAAATAPGWIERPEVAFEFTHPEMISARPPAARLLRHRRDLQRAQEAHLAPERVVDGHPVWSEPQAAQWSGELSGQGAVPGRVEGAAGPLPKAGEAADGRIAVVHALTPQDIVFLPGVAGLVVERPGTCGHAVLIARELGIPTVTWAERAVERIPPGARVWIDGASGRVRWHQNY
jgi:pyruvate,water dikinase